MDQTETVLRLRATLDAVAGNVAVQPDAYERALHEWRRRERRRRRIAVALAAVLLALADLVGLWALNRSQGRHPVLFDAPPPAVAPQVPGRPSGSATPGNGLVTGAPDPLRSAGPVEHRATGD